MTSSTMGLSKDATGDARTRQERLKPLSVRPASWDCLHSLAQVRRSFLGSSIVSRAICSLRGPMLPWYIGTTMKTTRHTRQFVVERVQTGVRIEKRLLKVLKALAEFHDLTLGDLLEGIVLHAFDGKAAFQKPSRRRIKELKKFYGLKLDYRASHRLVEARPAGAKAKTRPVHGARRVKRTPRTKKTRGAK
jgi:hypothetical protein